MVVRVTPELVSVCNRYAGESSRVLLFSHATGFCKETWNPMIQELRALGNKDEILVVDQRNHGDSAVENRKVLPKGNLFLMVLLSSPSLVVVVVLVGFR